MITAQTIDQRVSELEKKVKALEDVLLKPEPPLINKTKKVSAKEFLMTKNLKSEILKTLALGYYLEHLEGLEYFNVVDLETAFRSAKEKPPKNINDAVNKNISKGFFMEAAERKDMKKAWVLTSSGENHVKDTLNK